MKIRDLTVIIDLADSTCGACGEAASPTEGSHQTIMPGYTGKTGVGCGVEWKYMTSNYYGRRVEERSKSLFPQYEWVDIDRLDDEV